MENQINKTVKLVKSNKPLYAIGIAALIYALVFPLYNLFHFLIFLAVCVGTYIIASRIFPPREIVVEEVAELKTISTGDAEADEILAAGKGYISRLGEIAQKIKSPTLRAKVMSMDNIARKIYRVLGENPEKAKSVRMFTNYYLPTTIGLLENYLELERQSDVGGENIKSSAAKIEEAIGGFTEAYQKLLDGLYQDKAMNIQADITVLDNMMRKQGLTSGEDEILKMAAGSENITDIKMPEPELSKELNIKAVTTNEAVLPLGVKEEATPADGEIKLSL